MTRVFYTSHTVWRQSKCHTNWYWIYWYCKFQSGKVGVYDIVNRIADIGMSSRRLSVQEVMFLSILVKRNLNYSNITQQVNDLLSEMCIVNNFQCLWICHSRQSMERQNSPSLNWYWSFHWNFFLYFNRSILSKSNNNWLYELPNNNLCTEPSAITTVKPAYTTTSIRQPLVEDNQCWVRPSQFPYNCYCIRQSPV